MDILQFATNTRNFETSIVIIKRSNIGKNNSKQNANMPNLMTMSLKKVN